MVKKSFETHFALIYNFETHGETSTAELSFVARRFFNHGDESQRIYCQTEH